MSTFQISLLLMGRGMAAIFTVIIIIYIAILLLGKLKDKEEAPDTKK